MTDEPNDFDADDDPFEAVIDMMGNIGGAPLVRAVGYIFIAKSYQIEGREEVAATMMARAAFEAMDVLSPDRLSDLMEAAGAEDVEVEVDFGDPDPGDDQ